MTLRILISFATSLLLIAPSAYAAEGWKIWSGENGSLELSTRRFLTLSFDEPDLELRIGGRFHGDAAIFDDDATSIGNDVEIRRGRAYFSGRLFEDWSVKVEYEFSDERSGWRNLWARYQPFDRTWIKAGNFIAPFGLEDVGSSNDLTFMERSLASAIAPSFGTGGAVHHRGYFGDNSRRHRWGITGALTVAPLNDRQRDIPHRSDHWAVTSRVSYAPIASERRVVHLAGSVEYRDVNGGSSYRVRSRPESILGPYLVNTGLLADVDQTLAFGAEAAVMYGPFSVQGEYMRVTLDRSTNPDPDFYGWYVLGSWVITGESRSYSRSRAVFIGVDPESPWGALELAARYSTLDLIDGGVNGGTEDNITVGLNWYILQNLRLMFNYVHVNARPAAGGNDDPEIFQFRVALFF